MFQKFQSVGGPADYRQQWYGQALDAQMRAAQQTQQHYRETLEQSDPHASMQTPVLFCSSRDQCAHVRSCVKTNIHIHDGTSRRRCRPSKKAHTVAAYISSGVEPLTPTYVISTSLVNPNWINVTKTAALVPPAPLPVGYAQVPVGDLGFFANNLKLGDLVAISGVISATPDIYPETNSFNKWWYIVGIDLSGIVGGNGTVYTLAPYPFRGLRVGDSLQALYYSNDPLGPIGPMIVRIEQLNAAWCSWVLSPTNLAAMVRFQGVHIKACVPSCHRACPRQQTGRCDTMCRLRTVKSYIDAAPSEYEDRVFSMHHIKPYVPQKVKRQIKQQKASAEDKKSTTTASHHHAAAASSPSTTGNHTASAARKQQASNPVVNMMDQIMDGVSGGLSAPSKHHKGASNPIGDLAKGLFGPTPAVQREQKREHERKKAAHAAAAAKKRHHEEKEKKKASKKSSSSAHRHASASKSSSTKKHHTSQRKPADDWTSGFFAPNRFSALMDVNPLAMFDSPTFKPKKVIAAAVVAKSKKSSSSAPKTKSKSTKTTEKPQASVGAMASNFFGTMMPQQQQQQQGPKKTKKSGFVQH